MDSVWLDLDLPVRQWQGKNYKPLVAMLIVDLDSRVNVNTAGNFFPLPDPLQPPVAGNTQRRSAAIRPRVPTRESGHGK